jgi:hypothetical protein
VETGEKIRKGLSLIPQNPSHMKPEMLSPSPQKPERPKYKLKLDSRTTVTVRSKEALEMWMEKYPNAKLV